MKVLVAIDDSPISTRAARVAVDLFSAAGAQFVVVNVVDLLAPWVGATGFGAVGPIAFPRTAPVLDETDEDNADAEADLLARAEAAGVPGPVVAVRVGNPVTEICAVAEEEKVDVIVVGSHDKTTLRRLLDPSVAAGVVRDTYRPVLVVSGAPPPEERGSSRRRHR